jgi:glycosyltransferase involved in cell wall biosynthesis
MRVLFYNANRSSAFGGIEHWMLDVSQGISERGHHAVLYGRRGAGWLKEGLRRGITTVEGRFGFDLDPRSIAHLRATLRTHEIDAIFTKGKKGTRMAAGAAWLVGRGRVIVVLGLEGEFLDRMLDRWTWRWAVDRAVVLAEEAKLWYERFQWAADGKLHVLFKGVNVDVLDPERLDGAAVRAALEIPPQALVIGAVGRLVWQKGHVYLLQAAGRLAGEFSEARFLLVGGGEEEGPLRAQARELGIQDRVVFTGYQQDIPGLLAAMDIVVIPSRKENMPQVLLEAMAMARPVVSTATIGVREVLEDTVSGFVVPTGDVEALADRMRMLAASPQLRETMGERARKRILEGFTRDDMLDRVEHLIDGVCSGALGCTRRSVNGRTYDQP